MPELALLTLASLTPAQLYLPPSMSSVLPSKLKGVLVCTLDGTGMLPLQESTMEQKASFSQSAN